MVCVVWRLIFLYFHNSSKIEKDDKSPGEESDISDDDTGLLFYYLFFFHLECTLNPSIRVRELFNDFDTVKVTEEHLVHCSQSLRGSKTQSANQDS